MGLKSRFIPENKLNPYRVGENGILVVDRFWSKVDKKSDDECWEWLGLENIGGYGIFTVITNTKIPAHRYSYYLSSGYWPETNEYVCHKCDNRACVNPNHLFLGNAKDNAVDMVNKGRNSNTKGSKNPNSILNENDVLEIRSLYFSGVPCRVLLNQFEIKKTQLYRIIHKTSWKWLE